MFSKEKNVELAVLSLIGILAPWAIPGIAACLALELIGWIFDKIGGN